MTKAVSAEEKIRRLREEYSQSLAARFLEVNQVYTELLESNGDLQVILQLKSLSHTLCGSAGTFGFGEIATYCKRVEKLCGLIENNFDNKEVVDEISRTISQLEDAILSPSITDNAPLLEFTKLPKNTTKPRLIYILDDDKLVSRDLKLKIETFGFDVKCFHLLDEFFNAIEQNQPEAIIIDVDLNGDCGTDALKFLYEHASLHIPSIVISAKEDFEARLKTVRAGADAFHPKPIDTSEILDTLERITGNKNKNPFRVLIVDDMDVMSAYYKIVLERSDILCRTTTRPDEIFQILADFDPDLILMDLHMPECRGDELAKLIHQHMAYLSLPIVYLSAETSTKEQLAALQMAGDDFLTKPIRPSELTGTITVRAKRYRQIKSMINNDSLTGLLNHSSLKQMLDKECARSSRTNQAFCFVMLDMDMFKEINNQHGHAVGDMVLRNLAWLLKQRLRKTDIIGRYGGEEFGIIMPDTTLEVAEKIINELLQAFRSLDLKSNQQLLNVTFSAGIAAYPDYKTMHDLCSAADKFLYDAKFAGRNRVVAHHHPNAALAQAGS